MSSRIMNPTTHKSDIAIIAIHQSPYMRDRTILIAHRAATKIAIMVRVQHSPHIAQPPPNRHIIQLHVAGSGEITPSCAIGSVTVTITPMET